MLNELSEVMKRNSIENIVYRTSYVTGKITAIGTNNKYDVEIAGSGKSIKNIFVNDSNIVYAIGDTVGIGYEDGNRGRLIIIGILRDIIEIEVSSSVNALGV